MNLDILKQNAQQMVTPGKGILAADESTGTCQKRFDGVGVECTEESRRQYRQMLLTTPGLEQYISGVILFDETLRQTTDDGTNLGAFLNSKGILPGIKVDMGAKDRADQPGEKVTEGLEGLPERLTEYAELGAKFAKWRAVITIDTANGLPTDANLSANAEGLAKYAKACQEADIVPIVEPEVLIDGSHSLEECEGVTERALNKVFEQLEQHGVALEGMILKPSMVIAGKGNGTSTKEEVAEATIRCFRKTIPANVPGVAFLSGGQAMIQSTENLNQINQTKDLPWNVTFSYGRGLQTEALEIWAKNPSENKETAQQKLLHRAKMNGAASTGSWNMNLEG